MVTRSRGVRSKTRHKLRKKIREKGLPNVTKLLQSYTEGNSVTIKIDPSIHRGQPHPRFQGRTGKIVEHRGNAYLIKIRDGNKEKAIIARPEHIIPQKG